MSIKLTELGRHEAYLRLYGILTSLPIMKDKTDEYLKLERQFAAKLIKNWRDNYEQILNEIFRIIPKQISEQAIKIINENLSQALGEKYGQSKEVKQLFQKYIRYTYEKSKNEFALRSHFSLTDSHAVEVLTKHNCFWLGQHYEKHIGSKISEMAQQALENGLGRKEFAEELREALGGEVGGYKYWDIVSSAALVRARSFGAIAGMEEAGIAEYEILAMGDERMCSICDNMNGRVFSVAVARGKINEVLEIDDPEKFKEAMPWQSTSAKDVSNEALQDAGMSLPPFHGRCRCVVVMFSENIPEAHTIEEANEIAVKRGLAKKADFEGLDISVANSMIGCITTARREFPDLPVLDFLGSMQKNINFNLRENPNGQYYFDKGMNTRGIGLNAEKFSSAGLAKTLKDLKQGEKLGLYPVGCGKVQGTIYHEIGHWVSEIVNGNNDTQIIGLFNNHCKNMKNLLSLCAKENIHEMLAESWSEVHNNSQIRPFAKKVAARILELHKEKDK